MDKKTFSIRFLVFFVVIAIYLYFNNDFIANTIANDGLKGLMWYLISNVAYILLFLTLFAFNREVGLVKNIVGLFFIIYAMDIVSFPRLPAAGFPTDFSILASSDAIVFTKLMELGFSYSTTYFIYYAALPIALMLGALAILGIHNFYKQLIPRKN